MGFLHRIVLTFASLVIGISLNRSIVSPIFAADPPETILKKNSKKQSKKRQKKRSKKVKKQKVSPKKEIPQPTTLPEKKIELSLPKDPSVLTIPSMNLTSSSHSEPAFVIETPTMSVPFGTQKPIPFLDGNPDSPPTLTMRLSAKSDLGYPKLSFDWGGAIPGLSVIKDLDKWWIVFDTRANVVLPNLTDQQIPGLLWFENIPVQNGVVLRISTESELTPVINLFQNQWQIHFKPQPLEVQKSPQVQLPRHINEGLTVDINTGEKEITFQDPSTGYKHVVIPSHKTGFGLAQELSFPEFKVLATAQGVAFQIYQDETFVKVSPIHATVYRPEGLAITPIDSRDQPRNRTIPIGLFAEAQGVNFKERGKKITTELLEHPQDQHAPGELEIAWMLLSQGMSCEALSYLSHLAYERPSISDQPLFQTLQGLGSLLLNRFHEAGYQFRNVQNEPEVQVWLNLIKAAQQHDHIANSHWSLQILRAGKPIIHSYPDPLRTQLLMIILTTGISSGDLETTAYFLDRDLRPQNPLQAEVFDLAVAKQLMQQKKFDAGLKQLTKLFEKGKNPQVRAIAKFDYVVYKFGTKMMTEDEAINQLDQLRYQWRGDLFEYRVSSFLAERLIEQKRFPKALDLYKTMLKYFSVLARGEDIPRKIQEGFFAFFKQDPAPTPLEALGFYEDYESLIGEDLKSTPQWDQLIHQISNQFVSVDLLIPAIEVLTKHLEKRGPVLSALEKTKVQHQIAAIYLMTRKPDAALEIINHVVDCPAEETNSHALLRAEALAQQEKVDDALFTLKEIPNAHELKAEICFKFGKWSEAATSYKAVIAAQDVKKSGKDEKEKRASLLLNCVISMALCNDLDGLATMRKNHGDWVKGTDQEASFDFVTNDTIPTTGDPRLAELAKVDKMASFLKTLFEEKKKG